uniref:Zinc finger C3HC4 RING-type domain-containing protein n=1 Tax=Chelonoidis abingdonii TaxID=106734 RepID=A0A8C0GF91_CHEAB
SDRHTDRQTPPGIPLPTEELTCSLCLEYFKDPVIITECAHNFCRYGTRHRWGPEEKSSSYPGPL